MLISYRYKQKNDKVIVMMNTCRSAKWRIEAEKDKDIDIPFVLINGRKEEERHFLYSCNLFVFSNRRFTYIPLQRAGISSM